MLSSGQAGVCRLSFIDQVPVALASQHGQHFTGAKCAHLCSSQNVDPLCPFPSLLLSGGASTFHLTLDSSNK